MRKFMVALDEAVFDALQEIARGRDITIQELFRAIIIPDWFDRTVDEKTLCGPNLFAGFAG